MSILGVTNSQVATSAHSQATQLPKYLALLRNTLEILDLERFQKLPKDECALLDKAQFARLIHELDLPPLRYSQVITFFNGKERASKKIEFDYCHLSFLNLLYKSFWEAKAINAMHYKGNKARQVIIGREENPEDCDLHINVTPKDAGMMQLVFLSCLAKFAKITFRDDSSNNVRIYFDKEGAKLGEVSPIPRLSKIKALSSHCGHFFLIGGGLVNRFLEDKPGRKHVLYSLAAGDRKFDFHIVAELENHSFCSSKSLQVALHPFFHLMITHSDVDISWAPQYLGTDVFYVKTVDGYPLKTAIDHAQRGEFSIEPPRRAKTLSKGLLIFLRMLTCGQHCITHEALGLMEEKFRMQYYKYKEGTQAKKELEKRYIRGHILQRDLRIELDHIKDPRARIVFLFNFLDFIHKRNLLSKDKISLIVLYLILEQLSSGKPVGSFDSYRNFLEFCKVHVFLSKGSCNAKVLSDFPCEAALHFCSQERSFLSMGNPLLQNLFKLFPLKIEKGDFFESYKEELSHALANVDLSQPAQPLHSFSQFLHYMPLLSQLESSDRMDRHCVFLLTQKRHTFSDLKEKRAECFALLLQFSAVRSGLGFEGLVKLADRLDAEEIQQLAGFIAKEENVFYLGLNYYNELPQECRIALLDSAFAKTAKGVTALYKILPQMQEMEKEHFYASVHAVLTDEVYQSEREAILPVIVENLTPIQKKGAAHLLLCHLISKGSKQAFEIGLKSFKQILAQTPVDHELVVTLNNALINSGAILCSQEKDLLSLHLSLYAFSVLKKESSLEFPFKSLLHLPVSGCIFLWQGVLPLKDYSTESANYLSSFYAHEILCMRGSPLESAPLFMRFFSVLASLSKDRIPSYLLQVLRFRNRSLPSPGTQERENFDRIVLNILSQTPKLEAEIVEYANCYPVVKRGASQELLFTMIKAGSIRAFYTGIESVNQLISQKECDVKFLSEFLTLLCKSSHGKRAEKELLCICEKRMALYQEMEPFLLEANIAFFIKVFRLFVKNQTEVTDLLRRGVAKISKEATSDDINSLRSIAILKELLPEALETKREPIPAKTTAVSPEIAALVKKVKSQAPIGSLDEMNEVLEFVFRFSLKSGASIKILNAHFENLAARVINFLMENRAKKEIITKISELLEKIAREEIRASVAKEQEALSCVMSENSPEKTPGYVSLCNYVTALRNVQITLLAMSQLDADKETLPPALEKALQLHSKMVHDLGPEEGARESELLKIFWGNLLNQIFFFKNGAKRIATIYPELYPNPTQGILASFHLRLLQTAKVHFNEHSQFEINFHLLELIFSQSSASIKAIHLQVDGNLPLMKSLYELNKSLLNHLFELLKKYSKNPSLQVGIKDKIYAIATLFNGSFEKEKMDVWKASVTPGAKVEILTLVVQASNLQAEDCFERASLLYDQASEIEELYDPEDAIMEWQKVLSLLKEVWMLNPKHEKAMRLYCKLCIKLKAWEDLRAFIPLALASFPRDPDFLKADSLIKEVQRAPEKKEEKKSSLACMVSAAQALENPSPSRSFSSPLSLEETTGNVATSFFSPFFSKFSKMTRRLFQSAKPEKTKEESAIIQSDKAFTSNDEVLTAFEFFTSKELKDESTLSFCESHFETFSLKTLRYFEGCDGKKLREEFFHLKLRLLDEEQRVDEWIDSYAQTNRVPNDTIMAYSNNLYVLHLTLLRKCIEKNAGQDEPKEKADVFEALGLILEDAREASIPFWRDFLPLSLSTEPRYEEFIKLVKKACGEPIPDDAFFHGLRLAIVVAAVHRFTQAQDLYLVKEAISHMEALLSSSNCRISVTTLYNSVFNVFAKVVNLLVSKKDAISLFKTECLKLKSILTGDIYKDKYQDWTTQNQDLGALLEQTKALLLLEPKVEVKKSVSDEIRQAEIHYEEGKKHSSSPLSIPFEKTDSEWTLSLELYLAVYQKNPQEINIEICLRVCEMAKRLQVLEKAIPILEHCPQKPHAILNNLGIAYRCNGEIDKAIECFQKSLLISCDYIGLINLSGTLFERNKGQDREAALVMFSDCIDRFPKELVHYKGLLIEMREDRGTKQNKLIDDALHMITKKIDIFEGVQKGLIALTPVTSRKPGHHDQKDVKFNGSGKATVLTPSASAKQRLQEKLAYRKAIRSAKT